MESIVSSSELLDVCEGEYSEVIVASEDRSSLVTEGAEIISSSEDASFRMEAETARAGQDDSRAYIA